MPSPLLMPPITPFDIDVSTTCRYITDRRARVPRMRPYAFIFAPTPYALPLRCLFDGCRLRHLADDYGAAALITPLRIALRAISSLPPPLTLLMPDATCLLAIFFC